MLNRLLIFFFLLISSQCCLAEKEASFNVSSQKHEKIPCLVSTAQNNKDLKLWADIIMHDLRFTDQLEINNSSEEASPIKLKIARHKTTSPETKGIKILLTIPGMQQPILSQAYTFTKKTLLKGLHTVSRDILYALTSSSGPFLYTLTYAKYLGNKKKVICINDYRGNEEKIIVSDNNICTAPTWHPNLPVLLYSRFTKDRGLLEGINLKTKKQSTLISNDGLAMQPSFSSDGKSAILCSSQSGSYELYLYFIKNQQEDHNILKQLTFNKANNTKPCFLPSGDVIFCSDFERQVPQIYYFDRKSRDIHRLTSGKGTCVAPSYNAHNNSITYVRYTNGNFQLFSLSLNVDHPHERQLTKDATDKYEPSWSPCGNYIVYTTDIQQKSSFRKNRQIAVLNVHSKQSLTMTNDEYDKSFPSWTAQTLYEC